MRRDIIEASQRAEARLNEDGDVNGAYAELLGLLSTEMDNKLPKRLRTTEVDCQVTRRHRRHQKYWTDELNEKWLTVCAKERAWRKTARSGRPARTQKAEYTRARGDFDRASRRARRQYQRGQQQQLTDICDNDPKHFWSHLDKIGIGGNRKTRIPMEVTEPDGSVTSDTEAVLRRWKRDFQAVYNPGSTDSFDEAHLERVQQQITVMEQEYARRTGDTYRAGTAGPQASAVELNCPIQLEEVRTAVAKAKLRKATGVDQIPSEVLKNDTVIRLLFYTDQLLF